MTQYNKTVSSFEHRFIPRAQKLKNLGVTSTKDLPGSLEDITVQAKSTERPGRNLKNIKLQIIKIY